MAPQSALMNPTIPTQLRDLYYDPKLPCTRCRTSLLYRANFLFFFFLLLFIHKNCQPMYFITADTSNISNTALMELRISMDGVIKLISNQLIAHRASNQLQCAMCIARSVSIRSFYVWQFHFCKIIYEIQQPFTVGHLFASISYSH